MRPFLVLAHRWLGLTTALFLLLAGLTGAVIAWDHELDGWLNPDFFRVGPGTPQAPLALADGLERQDPRLRVTYLPLSLEPGQSLVLFVAPRTDPATGQPYALGFNQVALDPVSGRVLGRREWGRLGLDRRHLIPCLYQFHYSLQLPAAWGLPLGTLFMGGIALLWLVDGLVALVLAFPSRKTWRQSFRFRWRAGGYRLNFDLHRSGGVWLFPLLAVLAITSVDMNLNKPLVRPLVGLVSSLTPTPAELAAAQPPASERGPQWSRHAILARAQGEARQRGWQAAPGGLYEDPAGYYGVGFFPPGQEHGDGGLGNPWLYLDSRSGRLLGADVPGQGTGGDLFLQAMFPLHSGRILGLPGRVLVSCCGGLVALLSLTGVVIWARKRRARRAQKARQPGTGQGPVCLESLP